MNEDIAGNVHRKYYGKSDKANASENQNREFQDGFSADVDSLGFDARRSSKKNPLCAMKSVTILAMA